MYIYYDPKTDYLEILQKKVANYSEIMGNIFIIKAEKNHRTIGYGIENASKRISTISELSPFTRLSALIKIARLKRNLTQKQMAVKMGIGLLPYQRLESGNNNPTFKTLILVKKVIPEFDLPIAA